MRGPLWATNVWSTNERRVLKHLFWRVITERNLGGNFPKCDPFALIFHSIQARRTTFHRKSPAKGIFFLQKESLGPRKYAQKASLSCKRNLFFARYYGKESRRKLPEMRPFRVDIPQYSGEKNDISSEKSCKRHLFFRVIT